MNTHYNPATILKHYLEKSKITQEEINNYYDLWRKESSSYHLYQCLKFDGDRVQAIADYVLNCHKPLSKKDIKNREKFEGFWREAFTPEAKAREERRSNKQKLDFVLYYRNEVLLFRKITKAVIERNYLENSTRWINKYVNARIDLIYGHTPKWIDKSELTIRRNLQNIYSEILQAQNTLRIRKDAERQKPIYTYKKSKSKLPSIHEKAGTDDHWKSQVYKLKHPEKFNQISHNFELPKEYHDLFFEELKRF